MPRTTDDPMATATVVSEVSYVPVDGDKIAAMAAKPVADAQVAAIAKQAEHLTKVSETLMRDKHALEMRERKREIEHKEAEWQAKYPEAAAEERKATYEKNLYDTEIAARKKELELRMKQDDEEKRATIRLMTAPLDMQNFKESVALFGYTLVGIGLAFLYYSKL